MPSNRRSKLQWPLFLRVYFLRFFALIVCLTVCLLDLHGQAQTGKRGSRIIDDTTKQVYGPKTSRYYYESDVFMNRLTYHTIDTVIRDFHQFNYVQRSLNTLQDQYWNVKPADFLPDPSSDRGIFRFPILRCDLGF